MLWLHWLLQFCSAQGAFYSVTKIPESLLDDFERENQWASLPAHFPNSLRTVLLITAVQNNMLLIYLTNEESPHRLHPSLEITELFSLSRGWILHPDHLWASLTEFHSPGRQCASLEGGPKDAGVHGTWSVSLFSRPPRFPREWCWF